ncbi:prohead protease/major capsid protein fusion protein [Hyphococcus sp.]|uniref:prohead protease/major capsid protein fusion protein n=1 Tax=Hyphococcus sp. TaxID=2038636 RepID=UPI0035C6BC7B
MAATTLNREARTVEAVIATEAKIPQRDFVGPYSERLRITPEAVDLTRLIGGPVLDGHRRGSHRDQIGVVERVRFENRKLVALLRFFKGSEGDAIMDKIEQGMRGVSIGFLPEKDSDSTEANGERIRTIEKWTPFEVSLAPVPADHGAQIRSATMPDMDRDNAVESVRAEEAARIAALRKLSVRGHENELEQAIRSGTSPTDFAVSMSERERSHGAGYLEERQRAERELGAPRPDTISSGGNPSLENPEFRKKAMAAALVQRALPGFTAPPEAEAYRGWSIPEMAREELERSGFNTRGMRPDAIMRKVTNRAGRDFSTRAASGAYGAQGSGDFVGTIGFAGQMIIMDRYKLAQSALKTVAREMSFNDYRPHRSIRGSAFPQLKEVAEHGEITRGQLADVGEDITLIRLGRIAGLTHQALVNDSVGQFADLMTNAAETAIAAEANLLAAKVEENANMADGKTVFHADHNNLAGVGAAPDEATLSARRSAMRKQTGLNNERIAPTPKFLLVPTDLETTAEKLVAQITPAKTDDANVFSNLGILVEPRLSDAVAWYLIGDPDAAPSLRYGYLDSEGGPIVDERPGWEIDGIEVRVRLSFGCGFVDFRGWQKNPGQ